MHSRENLLFLGLRGRTRSVFYILKEIDLDTFKHVEGYENTGMRLNGSLVLRISKP
jgi:hypothetical protein